MSAKESTEERFAAGEAELGLDWQEAARAAGERARATSARVSDAENGALRAHGTTDPGEARAHTIASGSSRPVRYQRLPLLEVVLERWSRAIPRALRALLPEPLELRAEPVAARRFADYLAALPNPAVIALFRTEPWDGAGLLALDQGLTYALVDLLLGGREIRSSAPLSGRACTEIEAVLLERPLRAVLAELGKAFAPIAAVAFLFDRIETDPRFLAIARANDSCVLYPLLMTCAGRGGRLELVVPYAALEPVRELLEQDFPGERFGRDPLWQHHLARELWASEVELEAVLAERSLPLREVLTLAVGATLPLETAPEGPVLLRCGDRPLFEGHLGRRGDRVSVRIERRLDREAEA